ncbi:MAG: hypothetical protein ABSB83_01285 [Methanomassiliicoccales archaeon]
MKFCYCPECKTLHPKNWYSRGRCEICHEKCTTVTVRRSVYGWLMYITSIAALLFIALYVGQYQMNVGYFEFMSPLPSEAVLVLMFGSIILAFIFQFIELDKASREAERIVRRH